jgi:hypothetical protein
VVSGQPSAAVTLTSDATFSGSVSYSCLSISGTGLSSAAAAAPPGEFSTNNVNVTCYFNLPTETAPTPSTLTICTALPPPQNGGVSCTATGTLAMIRPSSEGNLRLSLYGLELGLPGIVLLSLGASSAFGSGRRRLGHKGLLKVLGVTLGISLLFLLLSCGGGFHATVIPPQTGKGATPAGSYTLTVVGTNQTSVQVYTVPFSVSAPQ